jgi:hypothetical protein
MRYLLAIVFLLSFSSLFAQDNKDIKKGNELYAQKKYKDAEVDYRKASGAKGPGIVSQFNLGDALYKQKKFADAGQQFDKLAETPGNKKLTAAAYHNMGNSLLQSNKLQESIDAYKKALLANPQDDETRYNLAYAEEKLKQQNKQNQQNKNQQNKDQNKQNQQQQNKDNKDKNNKDQDKQNQDQQNKDKQNQDKKDQQNGQQPNQMSKEDAQRMLDALNNQEQQTQDKLKNKKFKSSRANITKDW